MEDLRKRATSLYHNLTLIPSIDAAYLLPPSTHSHPTFPVLIKSTQTDVHQANKKTYLVSKSISVSDGKEIASSPFPFDISSASLVSPSPTGKRLAVVRIDGDKKDEPFIEIWESNRLVHNVHCKGKGHTSIYADEWFGVLEWSPDEKYVAYIAEPSVTKSSFWDKDQKDASQLGNKFNYREDWGEGFIGLASPSIFLLEIDTENILSVKLDDKSLSVGQATWSPSGSELVFTAWPITNRRLGLRYCYNRDSAVYRVTLAEVLGSVRKGDDGKGGDKNGDDKSKADATSFVKAHLVSDPPKSHTARFPRFSPDGSTLVYLGAEGMHTHAGGTKLYKVDWATKHISVVLDTVARPSNKDSFPGLFIHSLPRNCFVDNNHILTETQWCSALVPIVIDLHQKNVQRLPIPEGYFSAVVEDVVGAHCLLVCSSPAAPPALIFGKFTANDISPKSLVYSTIHAQRADILKDVTYSLKQVTPTTAPTDLTFEAIFVHPKVKHDKENFPLLVFPHGGPHSAFTGEYSTNVAFYALMGYAILMINYRGSVGFGTDFVDVLPGRCGELDVLDCVDAAHLALSTGIVDPARVGVIGGSHGGFLSAHLIGGSFDKLKFKACAMRNPVINLVSMVSTSDIPDWCFVETGTIPPPADLVATDDHLHKMRTASPITTINAITTPTYILLGENDKRVPPSQGLELYHALVARHIPCRLQLYPKNGHALNGADADPDQAVTTVLFLHENNVK